MIKVEDFSRADELELFISIHNIKREDIIDIKWAAAKMVIMLALMVFSSMKPTKKQCQIIIVKIFDKIPNFCYNNYSKERGDNSLWRL